MGKTEMILYEYHGQVWIVRFRWLWLVRRTKVDNEYRVHVTFKKALLMICCLEHCTILETKVYLSLGV